MQADNFINVTSMLRRLYNRLDHPNPYHRLGSAMACSRLYRVMRVHTPIIDRHLLEILFFCIKSLRIAEEDHEQIGIYVCFSRSVFNAVHVITFETFMWML